MPAPRKCPDEPRERAVREVRTSGRPAAHVAKDLGIHKEALRGRVRQAEAGTGDRPDPLATAERAELAQLRKEITRVATGERDPEGRLGVVREGARPAPHEADAVISHLGDDFGAAGTAVYDPSTESRPENPRPNDDRPPSSDGEGGPKGSDEDGSRCAREVKGGRCKADASSGRRPYADSRQTTGEGPWGGSPQRLLCAQAPPGGGRPEKRVSW